MPVGALLALPVILLKLSKYSKYSLAWILSYLALPVLIWFCFSALLCKVLWWALPSGNYSMVAHLRSVAQMLQCRRRGEYKAIHLQI